MSESKKPPIVEIIIILKALQQAVTAALGQYVVVWDGNKPVAIGEDVPENL